MQLKNKRFSRRRFLKAGSIGLAGLWSGCSDQMAARAVRGFLAESCRSVLKPRLTPLPWLWDCNRITAAWLGHSTVLVSFYGFTVLTDPVLFRRIGPATCLGTVGPKRLIEPALTLQQLPPIDLVLLSHAHLDHLDIATLRSLPGKPQAVTSYATEDLLMNTGVKNPVALRWGDKTRICAKNGDLEVQAFEVNHWGARWRHDNYRGYNGYILSREGRKIIFGGDTAWTESFRNLRSYGKFLFAIMPIGAYQPWISSHCSPEQAVRMTNDAGAGYLLPIHFKTFAFGREGTFEPMRRLEASLESERISWREVGETFVCPV
jgi:L-ascorbate metabolism protein UlaG (beta-lactamase superfamily)